MGHMHAVNCGSSDCDLCYPEPDLVLNALNADDYRIGSIQCLPYNPLYPDPAYSDLFPDDFLSVLYLRMRYARVLERTFCGMTNLSHNAVLQYLLTKPLFIPVRWHDDNRQFDTLGMGWIGTWNGVPPPGLGPRSAFGAYMMMPEVWGKPEMEIGTMLGLARMFRAHKLIDVFGQRYTDNTLTARYMSRFGFRDIGTIPQFLLRKKANQLVMADCTISRLTRKDFTLYVENKLIEMLP